MMVAAMQGANQHISSSLGLSILPKDTATCRPGELNQQPSDNNTLALPLSNSHQPVALKKLKTAQIIHIFCKTLGAPFYLPRVNVKRVAVAGHFTKTDYVLME